MCSYLKRNNADLLTMLEKIRQGEKKEFDKLYQLYTPLINSKVAEFSQSLESDEIIQISSIALYDAAMSYNPDKVDNKVTFGLYADICIRNRLISELRRQKLSEALDDHFNGLEHSFERASSPEDYLLRKEDMLTRLRRAKALLTPYESSVFFHYLSGKSYEEIAQALGKSRKSVDNALRRIRDKFKDDHISE